jgi:signal transduction histidine kinase
MILEKTIWNMKASWILFALCLVYPFVGNASTGDTTVFYKSIKQQVDSLYTKGLYEEAIEHEISYFGQSDTNVYTSAMVYSSLAEKFYLTGKSDSALWYLNKAYVYYLNHVNDTAKATRIQNNMGVVYYISYNIGKALEIFSRNLDFSRVLKDTSILVLSYTNLVSIYGTVGQWGQGKRYIDSLFSLDYNVDSVDLSKAYYVLSRYYDQKGEFKRARQNIYKAKSLYPSNVYGANDYLSVLNGGILKNYLSANKLDSAKEILNRLPLYRLRKRKYHVESDLVVNIAEYYIRVDSLNKARQNIEYLKSGLGNSAYRDLFTYYGIHKLYRLLEVNDTAISYLDSAFLSKTLAINELFKFQIDHLKKGLKNARKAKQLESAKAKLAKNEVVLLQKNNNLYLASLILLLFIVAAIWLFQSRRQKVKIQHELEHELKEKVKALEKKGNDLNSARQELNDLIYGAAHDMRSPITNLMGLNSMLINGIEEPQLLKLIKMQEDSINRVDNILKGLVDYHVVLSENIECEPIEINSFLNELKDTIPAVRDAWSYLEIKIETNQQIKTDRYKLKIIISNLVLNAIASVKKQQEKARVQVVVKELKDKPNEIAFIVSDNGKGVPEGIQPKIFKMFVKGEGRNKNSGLGLYVVNKAVSSLGGYITFDSIPNVDTSFKVVLPVVCNNV